MRNCSNKQDRNKRLKELEDLLVARDYDKHMVEAAIEKARAVPRERALMKSNKPKQTQRSVFVTPYDPRLPAIIPVQAKHWKAMVNQATYLKQEFPEPPMTAFRKQKNIRGHLIRVKVASKPKVYPKRYKKGMKKCGNGCTAWPYIKEGNKFKINGIQWNIKKQFDCNTYNLVYAILCKKDRCNKVYIGESKRMLWARIADHRGYVSRGEIDKATGAHFTQPGHSLADLRVTVLENTRGKNTKYRKEREHYYIRKFNTFYEGLNKQK